MSKLTSIIMIILALGVVQNAKVGTVASVETLSVGKAPSGLFYDSATKLLNVLCGTNTNGDHYLYMMNTAGQTQCLITIPQSVGMSRVDGIWISGNKAYIVDSQGPIYASDSGKTGGSVYEVDWTTHPCSCTSSGKCGSTTVSWTPIITRNWAISATDATIKDGSGNDDYFRNSGIAISGTTIYAVNGVHPIDRSYTKSYPKSLIAFSMSAQQKSAGFVPATKKWSFDATQLGHNVDMEGLACGSDNCVNYIYIGDEYNFIYKLDKSSGLITYEWDLRSIVGNTKTDKGIESLTFDGTYWYAGIQGTSKIHKVTLSETVCTTCDTTKNGIMIKASWMFTIIMFIKFLLE